jgi:predicted RNA binding protein YcfA (HicA-like mRNA interferase family)
MNSISGKKFCKIIEKRGWVLKRITGSHHIYQNFDNDKILSIPIHGNQDLKIGTLKSLMRLTNLSEEDLD